MSRYEHIIVYYLLCPFGTEWYKKWIWEPTTWYGETIELLYQQGVERSELVWPRASKRSLSVLTGISGDRIRRLKFKTSHTCSGQCLAVADKSAVHVVYTKCEESAITTKPYRLKALIECWENNPFKW